MPGFPALLFLLFLGLKLTDYIDWSWWWVTSPLWITLGRAIVWGLIVAFIGGTANKKMRL